MPTGQRSERTSRISRASSGLPWLTMTKAKVWMLIAGVSALLWGVFASYNGATKGQLESVPPRQAARSPETGNTSPETETRALVPHRVTRDQALRPGAHTVDVDVYDRTITKADCAALMNAYASRAGTGRVAVWRPGSGPTADAAGSNIDHASSLCLCHFGSEPPECYFHLGPD
jgi:hypothetical protein